MSGQDYKASASINPFPSFLSSFLFSFLSLSLLLSFSSSCHWLELNIWCPTSWSIFYFFNLFLTFYFLYVFLKSLDLCSCLNSHTYFFNVFYAYVTYLIVTGSVLLEIHSSFLFNFNRYLIFQCMENLGFFCSYIAHLPLENVLWLNCYLLLSCSGGLTTREYIFFIAYVC